MTLTMTVIMTLAKTLLMTLILPTTHIVMNLLVLSGRCRDDDPKLLNNSMYEAQFTVKDQGAR